MPLAVEETDQAEWHTESGQSAVEWAEGLVDVGQRDGEPNRFSVDLGQEHLLGDCQLLNCLAKYANSVWVSLANPHNSPIASL